MPAGVARNRVARGCESERFTSAAYDDRVFTFLFAPPAAALFSTDACCLSFCAAVCFAFQRAYSDTAGLNCSRIASWWVPALNLISSLWSAAAASCLKSRQEAIKSRKIQRKILLWRNFINSGVAFHFNREETGAKSSLPRWCPKK